MTLTAMAEEEGTTTVQSISTTPAENNNNIAAPSKEEATRRFSEIAAAHAILSDSARKEEYDHLYKFGAFDGGGGSHRQSDSCNNTTNNAQANNYKYVEDYSGGYYRKGYTPTPPRPAKAAAPTPAAAQSYAAAAAAAFNRMQSMQSQDSFFDELIYSPRSFHKKDQFDFAASGNNNPFNSSSNTSNTSTNNNNNNNNTDTTSEQQITKPGIGFSFKPLGKHLSVHVPSRTEVMTNVARGGGGDGSAHPASHLFGTRVTFSQQSTSGIGNKLEQTLDACTDTPCGGDGGGTCGGGGNGESSQRLGEKKVVCQTTRIAKGQRRMVKRTAHLKADGTREVVIEENGVVRRRYVEEGPVNNTSATTAAAGTAGGDNGQNGDNSEARQNRDDDETGKKEEDDDDDGTEGGLQKERRFTLMGLFRSCLGPCASVAGG